MKALRPFFSFYGAKWRIAPRYPAPAWPTIVEPFAGSASYSLRYPERSVVLVDLDERIVGTWDYLTKATEAEIRALPLLNLGESVVDLPVCQEARWLVGWWLNKAGAAPCLTPSSWMRDPRHTQGGNFWGPVIRERIASQVGRIRHWRVEHGSYESAPEGPATYFVDPPYAGRPGRYYTHGSDAIEYARLGEWCRSRDGQVIACEAADAEWLPFRALVTAKATSGRNRRGRSPEALWTNDEVGQATLFEVSA